MLDIKFIRENPKIVKQGIKNKKFKDNIDELLKIDKERRESINEIEVLKSKKNEESQKIGQMLREKKDISAIKAKVSTLAQDIKKRDGKMEGLLKKYNDIVWSIPNIPHKSVPVGTSSADNKVYREWGKIPKLDYKPKDHIELGEVNNILDFPRAAKIAGSGFALYRGLGARLERALINYMLDFHISKHGYTEIFPPFLVNRKSMIGTGQLPLLEDDMYRLKEDDLFLIPTAEVPVTNMHADEMIPEEKLPIYYTAYSACFRREAGSYGKDTRGLIRVHQFDKVELVKFVKPQTSFDELEKLLNDAEDIIKSLELPYRVMELCSGDMSFSACKCYDIELWAPGTKKWLEVSSCSNFVDFQARRANIRFKGKNMKKPEFVHTLNGSGVALARLVIAIMENHQNKDGSINIPKHLIPYMNNIEKIKNFK